MPVPIPAFCIGKDVLHPKTRWHREAKDLDKQNQSALSLWMQRIGAARVTIFEVGLRFQRNQRTMALPLK